MARARIQKISWMKRVSIVEILQRLNEERSLMRCIEWRKKKWIGHILTGEGLLRDGFEGRIEVSRVRDRRKRELLGGLKNRSNYVELKRRAKDRFNK